MSLKDKMSEKTLSVIGGVLGIDLTNPKNVDELLSSAAGMGEMPILEWKRLKEKELLKDNETSIAFQVIEHKEKLAVVILAMKVNSATGQPVFSRPLFPLIPYSEFASGKFTFKYPPVGPVVMAIEQTTDTNNSDGKEMEIKMTETIEINLKDEKHETKD